MKLLSLARIFQSNLNLKLFLYKKAGEYITPIVGRYTGTVQFKNSVSKILFLGPNIFNMFIVHLLVD